MLLPGRTACSANRPLPVDNEVVQNRLPVLPGVSQGIDAPVADEPILGTALILVRERCGRISKSGRFRFGALDGDSAINRRVDDRVIGDQCRECVAKEARANSGAARPGATNTVVA